MNKNMKKTFMLIFMLCVLSLYACATGTKVFVNNQYIGKTPAIVCLERDKTYNVTLQRGGNENVMNINVKTDLYKPAFLGAGFFVDMNSGVVIHGIETMDEFGNLNFQREININIPRDKDSVVVKFVTDDTSPYDLLNEEFAKRWLSGCRGEGKKNIPVISPFLAESQ